MKEFKKLGLSTDIVETLSKKGFKVPTAIQEKTIPLLLEGEHDVIGQAQTGTGKTASFSLPIIEIIQPGQGFVQALVLAPTRELAMQVAKEIYSLQGKRELDVLAVYGGSSITNQIKALRKGVDIVVGTPGRVMDLMRRKELHLNHLTFMVLDEADEMLNMGFLEDITWILRHTPKHKRMLCFSATMPKPILEIAKKFMHKHVVVKIESKELTIDTIDQVYYAVKSNQRYAALRRILAVNKGFHGIIFCKTKRTVDALSQRLVNDNYGAAALHGDITQAQRTKILNTFRKGNVRVLVATDVAARGIDVENVTHVINYSLPQKTEAYVHRIGRTGRAGKQGVAITFVMPSETRKLSSIERITKKKVRKGVLPNVEEVISSKKEDMVRSVRRIINKRNSAQFSDVADTLLEKDDAKTVVSALLKFAMQNDLDKNAYEKNVEEFVAKEGRSSRKKGARRSSSRRSGEGKRTKRRKSSKKDGDNKKPFYKKRSSAKKGMKRSRRGR